MSQAQVSQVSMASAVSTESLFNQACDVLLNGLQHGEALNVQLSGEDVEYLRFNRAKIRQFTRVQDACLNINFIKNQKQIHLSVELTGCATQAEKLNQILADLRKHIALLPDDPFLVLPVSGESSHQVFQAKMPESSVFKATFLEPFSHLDIVGIHQSGTSYRGVANSAGLKHWFETSCYSTDYSIFQENGKAVKGTLAGKEWNTAQVAAKLKTQTAVLERLNKQPIKVKPGKYRVYLEPDATAELVAMLSYRGVSESALRQGESSLGMLVSAKKTLSEKFSITEDFSQGLVPRFNGMGELAPLQMHVFEKGRFKSSLISPRTAKEYGLQSTGATSDEVLRSPVMATGSLDAQDALKALGTGVYLSNLHYLNWSDVQGARVTGMTRYSCMWVENGEFVAPIVDLRFDESLFDFFGHKLENCTTQQELIPEVGSYGGRNLGGCIVPGILVNDFTFTL